MLKTNASLMIEASLDTNPSKAQYYPYLAKIKINALDVDGGMNSHTDLLESHDVSQPQTGAASQRY